GDDHVAGDLELAAGDRLRAAAAARVRRPEAGAHEAHAAHLAVLVGEDLLRRAEVLHGHALEARLVDLLLVDDHLLGPAAVDDRARLGAEAEGGARRVHGGVAAPDDDHVLADPLGLA